MRKLLILALAVAALASCKSVPFFSTSYGEAHPNGMWDNGDGSTTIEFKFIIDQFDARKAMERIDEYLAKYAEKEKFSGYDVVNVNDRPINSGEGSSWAAPAGASYVMSPSDVESMNGRPQFVHIRVQVRFQT
ncbi:MAG: hypothetical protein ACLQDL_07315 [Spirochaetia bacterium]